MKHLKYLHLMLLGAFVALSMAAYSTQANAVTLTSGTGWKSGVVSSTTDALSYDFTLTEATYFSLSDCCIAGDIWTISGTFAGVSSFALAPFLALPTGLGDFAASYDADWLDISLSHFQTLLGAGSYSIRITGDGAGGIPAEVGVRLDAATPIPLPAALPLLLAGLGGLGALSLRRKKA